ncbi:MAG: hypothetical protein PHN57_05280 [Candidatus Omnitrophica bacterium]|nr:hypothetical protein [Candidatus Omnitrophota bacterium]
MVSKTARIIFVMFLSLAFFASARAQDKKENNVSVLSKEITGVVSGLSSNFIAVTLTVESESVPATEFAFNIDKKIRVVHKKNLSEIKFGDTVKINYDETTKTLDDGRKIVKNTAKMITFLKAAPKEAAQVEIKTSAPQQSTPESDSLSLKGLKGR